MRPKLRQDTDATHVSRILTRLDLRDRAQAVVFGYENRVVTAGPPIGATRDHDASKSAPVETASQTWCQVRSSVA